MCPVLEEFVVFTIGARNFLDVYLLNYVIIIYISENTLEIILPKKSL